MHCRAHLAQACRILIKPCSFSLIGPGEPGLERNDDSAGRASQVDLKRPEAEVDDQPACKNLDLKLGSEWSRGRLCTRGVPVARWRREGCPRGGVNTSSSSVGCFELPALENSS